MHVSEFHSSLGTPLLYTPGQLGAAALAIAPVVALLVARRRERFAVSIAALTISLTLLPNIDTLLPIAHRGPTHTLQFALLVGLVVGAAAGERAIRRGSPVFEHAAWGAFAGSYAILVHLAADVLTPMGIRPFAPIADAHYTLAVVSTADPTANASLLFAGALALAAGWNAGVIVRGAGPSARETVAETVMAAGVLRTTDRQSERSPSAVEDD